LTYPLNLEEEQRRARTITTLPLSLLTAMRRSTPGAAFFATKDVLKGYAKQYFGSEYRELTTIAAVLVANFPYCTCVRPSVRRPAPAGLQVKQSV